jgi:hypothetical protein
MSGLEASIEKAGILIRPKAALTGVGTLLTSRV